MIKKPPIAFAGHKGAWVDYIMQKAKGLPEGAKVIDAFGGSGMCARAVIEARPDLQVVWNDFDGYLERLDHAPETEMLRQTLQSICGERKHVRPKYPGNYGMDPLPPAQKAAVLNALEMHKFAFGYVDDLTVMNFLYSGPRKPKALDLNHAWVNKISVSPVKVKLALEHAEILRPANMRFDILAHTPEAAYYIIDPPYEKTDNSSYRGKDAAGVFPAIERICKAACGVMLFCASHELGKYAPLLPGGELEILKRNNTFKGASRFEACLCNW